MIQANEYRLGNLVNYTVNREPLHIGKITGLYVTQEEERKIIIDYHYPGVFGEPIPLTPDILEKCGFDKRGYKKLSNKLKLEWSFGNEFWIDREGETVFTFENINSLHQLQNLYFALTGEELNVIL